MSEIEALEDDEITKAFIPPKVPRVVANLFKFLQDNNNLLTTVGGMTTTVTGFDRFKLAEVGKGYGINIYRWMFAINLYEDGLLDRYNITDKD